MDKNIKGNEVIEKNGDYHSVYFNDSNIIIKELNNVSPSFCLAKWFNVSLHIPTGRTHSCYHPRSHVIPIEEIQQDPSALHNTKYKKEQRKKMLEGERPSECNFCWEIEDSGNQLSDRAYRSKDVYSPGIIEEAKKLGFKGNAKPRYLEVNFNQACNFRCSYCGPQLSTAWQKEVEQNGPYQLTDRIHNDLNWVKNVMKPDNGPDNPYLQAFWKWFPEIYSSLQTFRMTGGEPLMDKNTFKIFDYVHEYPKTDLNLSITSNCCPPGNQWNKFMKSLKKITDKNAIDHFMLFCSLDSWGKQAEYIRNGLNFDTLYNNITQYLSESSKHSLTFIITFNVLSYTGIREYLRQILELRKTHNTDRQLIWFDIPQLSDPDFMNAKLMPEMVSELNLALEFMQLNREQRDNRFNGFNDFEISKIQRLRDWILSDTYFNKEKAMQNFYIFWNEHDKRMGTDFISTFPELTEFYNKCKEIK
jgi:organic radical activating enzyme